MCIAIVLIHLSEKGAFINTLLKRTADYFLALKKKSFHIFNLVGIVSERLWQLGLLQDAHVQAVSMRAWWPGHLLPLQTTFAVTFTQVGLFRQLPFTLLGGQRGTHFQVLLCKRYLFLPILYTEA